MGSARGSTRRRAGAKVVSDRQGTPKEDTCPTRALDTSYVAEVSQGVQEAIVAAIRSLYDDELQPFGRILRKRLSELGDDRLDAEYCRSDNILRECCCTIKGLHVYPATAGTWSVHLASLDDNFVDVYSADDVYPPVFWEAFALHFSTPAVCGGGADVVLPGGRYLCARALASQSLPFLKRFSLGRICHIVQMAIARKQILGYADGCVVPHARSTSMIKKACAYMQLPCTFKPSLSTAALCSSWEVTIQCVREILRSAIHRGETLVPLSNIKRLARSVHKLDLSETALGYTRFSDLLQDERFKDVCRVELQSKGYVVLPASTAIAKLQDDTTYVTPRTVEPEAEQSPARALEPEGEVSPARSMEPAPELPPWVTFSQELNERGLLRCTFINGAPAPPTPCAPGQRASSVPRSANLCGQVGLDHLIECSTASARSDPGLQSLAHPLSAPKPRPAFCVDDPLCFDDLRKTPLQDFALTTPTPAPNFSPQPYDQGSRCTVFCKDEPLVFDDVGLFDSCHMPVGTPTPVPLSVYDPCPTQPRRLFWPDVPLRLDFTDEPGMRGPVLTPSPVLARASLKMADIAEAGPPVLRLASFL